MRKLTVCLVDNCDFTDLNLNLVPVCGQARHRDLLLTKFSAERARCQHGVLTTKQLFIGLSVKAGLIGCQRLPHHGKNLIISHRVETPRFQCGQDAR